MNVYRVAVMKNATHVIAVHNHPAGTLSPSEADKDITDRLIQVGRILNIRMEDHLIISTTSYVSFKNMGLMDTLEQSLEYVPTYQIIEQVRKEEKAIAKEAVQSKVKEAKEAEKNARNQATTLALALIEKGVDIESIAKILEITPSDVEKMINKKK